MSIKSTPIAARLLGAAEAPALGYARVVGDHVLVCMLETRRVVNWDEAGPDEVEELVPVLRAFHDTYGVRAILLPRWGVQLEG